MRMVQPRKLGVFGRRFLVLMLQDLELPVEIHLSRVYGLQRLLTELLP